MNLDDMASRSVPKSEVLQGRIADAPRRRDLHQQLRHEERAPRPRALRERGHEERQQAPAGRLERALQRPAGLPDFSRRSSSAGRHILPSFENV